MISVAISKETKVCKEVEMTEKALLCALRLMEIYIRFFTARKLHQGLASWPLIGKYYIILPFSIYDDNYMSYQKKSYIAVVFRNAKSCAMHNGA